MISSGLDRDIKKKKKIAENINHSVIPALHPKNVSQHCERLRDDNTSREKSKSIYLGVVLGGSRPGRRRLAAGGGGSIPVLMGASPGRGEPGLGEGEQTDFSLKTIKDPISVIMWFQ